MNKLLSLLFFISFVNAQAQQVVGANELQLSKATDPGASARVTLNLSGVTLENALSQLAKESRIPLFYDPAVVPVQKVINVKLENTTVTEALGKILRGTGIVALWQNGRVSLVRSQNSAQVKAQGVISGMVTDARNGRGIAGANVSVDKDSRGSVTGEDGAYRLVGVGSGNHTVTVRLVGYAKQTRQVTVGEGTTVKADFKLDPSANVLDQVVVTGVVAKTELRAIPNAISVITAKDIEARGITRIDQLFRGEIPGLFSMDWGAGTSLDEVIMYSRGATKISTSTSDAKTITNPIKTYVDGVELFDSKYLSQLDPRSIERIEILSGPQASTIYGSNAINGVMQIFTKRGTSLKPSINIGFTEGFAQNNFSSALSPSHQADGSVSGLEGKLSYNVGSSWDYTGAWTPSKQMQRASVYGGGRYQVRVISLDMTARQGWTRNNQKGNMLQARSDMRNQGLWQIGLGAEVSTPVTYLLSGRTVGTTVHYTPLSWWSHQVTLGTDFTNSETTALSPVFVDPADSAMTGNRQTYSKRASENYSSTLRFPLFDLTQVTFTYGADHWRNTTSTVGWTKNRDGTTSSPSITRTKPDKNVGAFVQFQLSLRDALFLTYGIREDWNSNFGANAKSRPSRYGLAYSRDINTAIGVISAKLRGSYGRSIKPPATGQVHGTQLLPTGAFSINTIAFYPAPLYTDLPNPELGAEFQQGGEGGLELYFGSRGSLVVTRYNQTVDGLITNIQGSDSARALQPGYGSVAVSGCNSVSTDPTFLVRSDGYCYLVQSKNLNIGSLRNQGWELQGSLNTGPFTTKGTYSWVKSRVIGITPRYRSMLPANQAITFAPGATFNYIPDHTWSMNVSYASRGTSVAFNINRIGPAFRRVDLGPLDRFITSSLRLRVSEAYSLTTPSAYRYPTNGYATANVTASQSLSNILDATFQMTNLTNHYQNDFFYQNAVIGRQTRIGVRWRWR